MIKQIKIRDFKSIREVDLNLDPVTVLVGRSGTGKSNIMQAIRFLRNVLLNQEQAIQFEWGWERILPIGEKDPRTAVEVVFSVPGEDQDYSYRLAYQKFPPQRGGPPRLQAERLMLGKEIIFSRSLEPGNRWQWEKAPAVAAVPNPADGPMLGSFPSIQKVVFAYAALSTGTGYYHFPASTLDRFRQQQAYQNQPQLLSAIPGLSDDANNYLQTIRGITQDFHHPNIRKNLLASLQAVNPSIVSVELDSLTSPQRAIVGHGAGGPVFELSLEQESDGFRRFYAHLLALYQTPSKLTLVFEEPENAIFPGALSLLADEFQAAPRENRGQVILTTHNPLLLDCFDVDNVRGVEMQDGKTVVGPVSKEQRDAVRDRLLTTGELLTVERPRLETMPKAEHVA
jgi:predicted ATPase